MDEENSKQEEETGRFSIKCLGGLMMNSASATCVITLKTTDCPAAPTLHSMREKEKGGRSSVLPSHIYKGYLATYHICQKMQNKEADY